jgi:hypothetical protein
MSNQATKKHYIGVLLTQSVYYQLIIMTLMYSPYLPLYPS